MTKLVTLMIYKKVIKQFRQNNEILMSNLRINLCANNYVLIQNICACMIAYFRS